MQPSKHNIIAPITGTDLSVIVNLLSGSADVIEPTKLEALLTDKDSDDPELIEKGYVVDPSEEAARFRQAYLDFIESRETDEVQLFYVPNYACNFNCSYCYQNSYDSPQGTDQDAVIAAFFRYVDQTFAGRRKYVTLFGGEPLLPTDSSRRVLEQLIAGTTARNIDLAIVTNGYNLERYLDVIATGRIREIQVTLDGPRPVHDGRRHLVNGQPTFDTIVRGIDAALAKGLSINLRTVIDRENIESYVSLARFAIGRGWTQHKRFKTQIGRNYELHECQADRQKLYTRLELCQELWRLAQQHPELLSFHRPTFSISRFLFDEGKLPGPLFDACPATKTEWAFDYTGHIYSCTATVGKSSESLGTFYPKVHLDADTVNDWEERDVLSIEQCRSCNLALACGGGCGSVAKNRTCSVNAADCRPIKELLSLGVALYAPKDALTVAQPERSHS
jgi:uncharacterized protein